MNAISIIARMTFREAIRRRIVLTGLILGLIFLLIFSIGFRMIYSAIMIEASEGGGNAMSRVFQAEASNFLLMAGLYAVAFLSVAMGALLSADTLAGEISSGTIQTIVTKPLRRSDVVIGKWLGFAGLLGLYSLLMSGGTVLSVYLQSGYLPDNLLAGLLLIYLEALVVMTVALACSSAMPALATGGLVFGLYGLAFIGGWIEQIGAIFRNETAVQVGIVSSSHHSHRGPLAAGHLHDAVATVLSPADDSLCNRFCSQRPDGGICVGVSPGHVVGSCKHFPATGHLRTNGKLQTDDILLTCGLCL